MFRLLVLALGGTGCGRRGRDETGFSVLSNKLNKSGSHLC